MSEPRNLAGAEAHAKRAAWFSADQKPALEDFWRVYEQHFEAVQAAAAVRMRAHERLAPMLRELTSEQRLVQQAESKQRLRRAIDGDWETYESSLRKQGAAFARMGLTFSAWYDMVGAVYSETIPRIVAAYASEPPRLSDCLVALNRLIDRVMSTIAEEYLGTTRELTQKADARHGLVLQASIDPVISMNEAGLVVEFNPAAERVFGYRRDEAVGKSLAELVIPERLRAEHSAGIERYLGGGHSKVVGKHVELTAMRRDGTEFPVELAIVASRSENAGTEFTGFIRDLTERKEAERSQQLWAHVFENAQFGLVISESESLRMHSVNEAYARMLGYRVEEIVGRSGQEFMGPDLRGDIREAAQLIETRGHHTFECTLLRKDGSHLPALASSSVLPSRPNEPPLRISTVIDATERWELERARSESRALQERNRRAEQANRLKSEFLANMSHELRTPLNSIIGFAELMHDGEVGNVEPQQKEFLGDILTSGKHLLRLINDVLDLSKIEAGRLEFHPEQVDLRRIVGEVLSILRTPAAEKQIRTEAFVSDEVAEVFLDPSRLKQVLYNYLSNAVKFTPTGGTVNVHVSPEGESSVRIEVRDTGIGISQADLPRLFKEFQQLDSGSTKSHAGTGLGLSLTKRLVEAQGGVVGASSVRGAGSCFFAILPRRSAGRPRSASHIEVAPPKGVGVPVLVVEDDPADQAAIVRILKEAGYEVDVASSGTEAIAKCRAFGYQALTLDLLLPDMNGLDVVRAVRAEGKNPSLPVIVLTVVAEQVTAGFAVNDVLAKPIRSEALLNSLRAAGVAVAPSSTIFVVDDDPASSKLVMQVLEQLGFRSRSFEDGRRALRDLVLDRPAAIILDLVMPGFDGFQFLAALREVDTQAKTPVLVWTMKDLSDSELELLRRSTRTILAKGGGAVELTTALRELIGGARARQAHGE